MILPAPDLEAWIQSEQSAEAPVRQNKPKVRLRQTGYDHQDNYKNNAVIASTLYGIARIAHDAFDWRG
jgi:hypothetical protein